MLSEWTTTTVRSTSPIDLRVTDGHRARSRCWSSANVGSAMLDRSYSNYAALAAPGPKPRPPARYCALVYLVSVTELERKRRLLVEADEREHRCGESSGVEQQDRPAEQERLADYRRPDCEVHRVADMTVEAPDDQLLRRRDRGGRPDPLDDETDERVHEHDHAADDQERADQLQRRPDGCSLPAGEPPRDEPGDDPGRDDEEQPAPKRTPSSGTGHCSGAQLRARADRDHGRIVRAEPAEHGSQLVLPQRDAADRGAARLRVEED